MLQRLRKAQENEKGFTLIELLVVVLIIAILAAIAIPVFLRQREKAYVADVQSLLRNGATAAESYATLNGGSYAGVGTATDTEGSWADATSRLKTEQAMGIVGTATGYCITASDTRLGAASADHDWQTATFSSGGTQAGSPNDADACT